MHRFIVVIGNVYIYIYIFLFFFFCYERYFMKSLSRENQADIIEAFNSTSRHLDDLLDLLNINIIYFDQMVDRIYLMNSS